MDFQINCPEGKYPVPTMVQARALLEFILSIRKSVLPTGGASDTVAATSEEDVDANTDASDNPGGDLPPQQS